MVPWTLEVQGLKVQTRSDRDFGPHVIRQQTQQIRRSLRGLGRDPRL